MYFILERYVVLAYGRCQRGRRYDIRPRSPDPGSQRRCNSHNNNGGCYVLNPLTTNSRIAQAFTHALYYLAANPEYAQPMRDEINEIVDETGWNRNALNQFARVDSFIKESQRLNALGCRKPSSFSSLYSGSEPFEFCR